MANLSEAYALARDEIDIYQYIHDHVTTDIKKVGRSFYISCPKPGAGDNTPSLHIDRTRNRFKCFHCNDWSGSILDLIMGIENISLDDAMEKLDRLYPDLDLLAESTSPAASVKKKARSSMTKLTNSMHERLLKSEYLNPFRLDRGFSMDAVKHFELGITNEAQFPRLYIPMKAGNGQTIGAVTRSLKPDDERPKYLTPSTVVDAEGKVSKEKPGTPNTFTLLEKGKYMFGLYKASKKEPVYVVEGQLDVIAAYDIGKKNNVACIGTHSMSADQAVILSRFPAITLIPDMDEPGKKSIFYNYKLLRLSGYDKPIFVSLNGYGVKDLGDLLNEVRAGKYKLEDAYRSMFHDNLISVEEHLLIGLDKTAAVDVLYGSVSEILGYAVEPITRSKALKTAASIVGVDANIFASAMSQEVNAL